MIPNLANGQNAFDSKEFDPDEFSVQQWTENKMKRTRKECKAVGDQLNLRNDSKPG